MRPGKTYVIRNGLLVELKVPYLGASEPPVANNDTFVAAPGETTILNVLGNDTPGDRPFDTSSVQITQSPAVGTATPNAGGSISYTAPDGYSGPVSFAYRVADTSGFYSAPATVTGNIIASGSSGDVDILRTVEVGTYNDLIDAVEAAVPGDRIRILNGTYNGNISVLRSGDTAQVSGDIKIRPILLEAANIGMAVLNGRVFLQGDYTQLVGCKFQNRTAGDSHVDVSGQFCRVSRNYFITCTVGRGAQRGTVLFREGAHDGEISYNEFDENLQRSICVRARNGGALRAHIHHNYIHDNRQPTENFAGVQIGIGGDLEGGPDHNRLMDALVEWNFLKNIEAGPIVAGNAMQCKSSRVTFQYNTLEDCDVGFSEVRTGKLCKVLANKMKNSGGFLIAGDDHLVAGNSRTSTPTGNYRSLVAMRGDVVFGPGGSGSAHPVARRVIFRGNTTGDALIIGGGDSSHPPPVDCVIEDHSGAVDDDGIDTVYRSATGSIPTPVEIDSSDVGPLADL